MAETKNIESGPANRPVSLPARGFEVGELNSALSKGMKDVKDEAGADLAASAAIEAALPKGQVPLDYDPSVMPGYEELTLAPGEEIAFPRTTKVYVPEDAASADVKRIETAQADGMAMGDAGKPVKLPADAGTTKGN
jgi:hypothetical protein